MRYAAMLGAFALFGAAIMLGSELRFFINVPSLMVVLGGGLLVSLSFHSPGELKNAWVAGLSTKEYSSREVAIHRGVLATMRASIIGSGVLGTLIGLVQMLASLDDPKTIGPAMAVALLTLVYSVFLSELCLAPMSNRLLVQDVVSNTDPGQPAEGPSGVLNVAGVFSLMVSFTILLAVFY